MKVTKANNKKFIKEIVKAITSLGGTVNKPFLVSAEELTEMTLQTSVGELAIKLYDNTGSELYTVFTRFENVDEAKKKFNCGASGKYNCHIFASDGVESAIIDALHHIKVTL